MEQCIHRGFTHGVDPRRLPCPTGERPGLAYKEPAWSYDDDLRDRILGDQTGYELAEHLRWVAREPRCYSEDDLTALLVIAANAIHE